MAAFTVTLSGGAPWGMSLAGGTDFNQPLHISKVTTGGKAAMKGLRPGLCLVEGKEANSHSDAPITYFFMISILFYCNT